MNRADDDGGGLLRAVFECVLDALVVIDEGGTILELNQAAEVLFHWDAAEILGRNVRTLVPPPHQSAHDGYLARYLETGERRIIGIGRRADGLRRDGTTFPMELAVTETLHGDRRVFVGTIRDLSDRRRAESRVGRMALALDRAEEHRQRLLDALEIPLCALGPGGDVRVLTAAWRALLGTALDDDGPKTWSEIRPRDPGASEAMDALLRDPPERGGAVDVFHLVPGGGIRRLTVEVRRDPLDHRARLVTLRPSSQDRSVSAPVPSLPSKKQRLLDALRETGGNRAAAARRLGIGRTTLYAQLRRFGIALPGDQD